MQWRQIRVRGPPLLYLGGVTTTNDQSAIVMAGETNHSHFGTWMFSPTWNKWMSLTSVSELKHRQAHSFVRANQTDFLLFGGFDWPHGKIKNTANDVWLFRLNCSHPESSKWNHIKPNIQTADSTMVNDQEPSPRFDHSAAVINSSMIIFGGQDQSGNCLCDLWSLDIGTYQWSLVTNNSQGPRPTKMHRCFSSAVAVGQHLLVTTGCSPSFHQSHPVECGTVTLQQTWLYLPHLSKWSFVEWIQNIYADNKVMTFLYRDFIGMPVLEDRLLLFYLSLQCPEGLHSSDMKTLPCQRCLSGTYSSASRKLCEACPEGLTTPTEGSTTIFNCSVCKSEICVHGKCFINQVGGRPSPVCQCMPGFTGTTCSVPTYYLIALSILLVTILIICGTCAFVRHRKRRLLREMELNRQVKELTSAWQVNYSELTLHNRIGAGGFGEVYKAEYRNVVVAVKLLRPFADEAASQEFQKEIEFMQTIRHPNIVLFIGAGKVNGTGESPFLVTEYVERGSLRGVLDQLDTELSSIQRIRFAARGMNFLHTRKPARIHCDFKSDNLLVSSDWVVKVADFGLGQQLPWNLSPQKKKQRTSMSFPLVDNDELQMTARAIGASRWRAPELAAGSPSYGKAADVYR